MLRDYSNAPNSVRTCYARQRAHHDVQFVYTMIDKYCVEYKRAMTVPQILQALDSVHDLSDPDLSLPNSQHALQAAHAALRAGEAPWMVVTALIHDFGKLLCVLAPNDDDGTSAETQWSIVGDTFICGAAMPPSLPFQDLRIATESEPYPLHCGLRRTTIAFGHDEFLYHVLRRMVLTGTCTLPMHALDAIRFHSLYAWHTDGAYTEFEDANDRALKPIVRRLNTYDLYSKCNTRQEYDAELARLFTLFFPDGCIHW